MKALLVYVSILFLVSGCGDRISEAEKVERHGVMASNYKVTGGKVLKEEYVGLALEEINRKIEEMGATGKWTRTGDFTTDITLLTAFSKSLNRINELTNRDHTNYTFYKAPYSGPQRLLLGLQMPKEWYCAFVVQDQAANLEGCYTKYNFKKRFKVDP